MKIDTYKSLEEKQMIKEVIEVLSSGVGIFLLAIILIGLFICKIIKDYKRARKGENEINFQKSDKYQKIYEEISKRELYKLRKKDAIIVAVFTTIITIATIAILIIELKKDISKYILYGFINFITLFNVFIFI